MGCPSRSGTAEVACDYVVAPEKKAAWLLYGIKPGRCIEDGADPATGVRGEKLTNLRCSAANLELEAAIEAFRTRTGHPTPAGAGPRDIPPGFDGSGEQTGWASKWDML